MDVQRDDSQGGGARDRDVYPKSAFTPDSKSLITSYDGKIWRVAVPTGEAVEIPFTAKVDQQLGPLVKFDYPIDDEKLRVSQIRGARPSPDGKRVVFTALDRLWIADLPQGRGTKKEKPAGAERRRGQEAGRRRRRQDRGRQAARYDAEAGRRAAAKPAAEAPPAPVATIRNARRLTTGTDVEHGPVWSPDGQFIAYVTWNDDDGGRIYRVRADGSGQPERLTPVAAFYDKLTYSRDGSRLIGVRGSKMHRLRTLEDFGSHSGSAELEYVWLPATGGTVSRIAWVAGGSTQQGREAPHVGPDPNRVYVWAGSDGLLSMRYDGTDIKTIVKVTAPAPPPQPGAPPGPPPTPDEVILSPDGKRALVRANRNVYMITVPPVAGAAPTVSAAASSSVPTWRLTKVGGDFIGWTADSQAAYFSIGRSFFLHDISTQAEVDVANRVKAETEAERAAAAPSTEKPADRASRRPTSRAQKPPAPPKIPTLEYEPHRVDVEIVVDKDKPKGVIALRNARLITMKGDEVIARGDIVITDNRITAIGPSGKVQIPAGAVVRNLSGKTIMPGLVDIHAHTWVAWGVHRSQVSQFLAQLAFGVTTQRDPQTSSEDALTYQDLMDTGQLIGPRLYSTGPGIFAADNIRSLDEARDVLRRYSDHYNTKTIKQYMVGDRKVRQWVIMAAKELGLTPTTEGGSNFTMNLTLMQDGYAGLEHTLPISPFFKDVVKLGAASGITYTPTLIVSYGGPIGRQHYLTNGMNVDEEQRLRRFTPHDELDKWKNTDWNRADQYVFPLHAKQLTKWVERRRQGGPRLARRGAGHRHALGAVDDGVRRHEAARRAEGGDHRQRRRDRLREGPRLARSRQAGGPHRPRRQPARRPQEHREDRGGDEERAALRRGDAERDLSAAEGAGPAVVVEAGAAGAAGGQAWVVGRRASIQVDRSAEARVDVSRAEDSLECGETDLARAVSGCDRRDFPIVPQRDRETLDLGIRCRHPVQTADDHTEWPSVGVNRVQDPPDPWMGACRQITSRPVGVSITIDTSGVSVKKLGPPDRLLTRLIPGVI